MDKKNDPYLAELSNALAPLAAHVAEGKAFLAMVNERDELKALLREGEQFMRHKLNCTYFDEITDTKKKQYCGPCDCGLSAHLEKLKSRIK